MPSCKKLMCKYGLNNKKDILKWLTKNHPDKVGSKAPSDFKEVLNCYKSGEYCDIENASNKATKNKKITITKKNRKKIFTCMRKTANFGKFRFFINSINRVLALNN